MSDRQLILGLVIVEAPVIAVMWLVCALIGAPWWTTPVVIGVALLLFGWIAVAFRILDRWMP